MELNQEKLNAFVGQMVGELSVGYGGVMASLGDKLGLYKAMKGAGPVSSQELAKRSDCAERYVREWLNSQAAAGYVVYHAKSATYELTPEQAHVLADDNSPVYLTPAFQVVASMWADEDKALEAFRTGKGVNWGDHDERLYCGVAAFYRNAYRGSLVSEWLPALDGVTAKLEKGAKVADVGCGHGHSTVLMAQAYPNSRFWGFDGHRKSVEAARRIAEEAGVADRVTFEVADAGSYREQSFDLICFFDCLHDMGRPVIAAAHARKALAKDGSVMLVEPYAGDRVQDNINPVGRIYYSASTTMCCAHAISEDGTHVLGAQAGQSQLASVFERAGFRQFRKAMQTPFNLILEARA
ncbi:class I SAM-dependent methyltransferase [Pseudolabrys sp.]|uniref:class I SAM-dependent methyltransferase n=1 Tax=Pseudolabrys sp. TaxID=1960880 RepID=UPI003D13F602